MANKSEQVQVKNEPQKAIVAIKENNACLSPPIERKRNPPSLSSSNISFDLSNFLIHKVFLYMNKNGYFSINSPSHSGITCKVCKKDGFIEDRYKCLVCLNFNMCGECFESRKVIEPHFNGHPMIRYTGPNEIFGETCAETESVTYKNIKEQFNGIVHQMSVCAGCYVKPIVGLRLKCDECNNFDLCSTCFEKNVQNKDHKANHSILVCYSIQNVNPSDIELLNKLGSGGFGTVYKAKLISKNKIVACKMFKYNFLHVACGINMADLIQSFIRELVAYNEFNSNYIIKTFGSCIINDNSNNYKFYLLTEFMENGSLTALLTKEPDISYRCRLSMACNIASGMKRIHEKNFIHRDIRPDNIFVGKNYVAKIGDMGIARLQDRFEQHSLIGSKPYMPNEFYTGKYNEKLDVFTFGLTLYHLITGSSHSFANGKIELVNKPIVFGEVIERCLQDDPTKRPTASSLENWLSLYHKCFWKIISEVEVYPRLSKADRANFFIKACNAISKQLFKESDLS